MGDVQIAKETFAMFSSLSVLKGLLIAAAVLTINSAVRADLTEKVTIRLSGTTFIGKVTAPMKGFLPLLTSGTIYKSGDKDRDFRTRSNTNFNHRS